ncbi:ANTAR domain-containing response regulator [Vibrio sp. MA40-2]|uniref:ANTAR domain-containing response regulator n=1 Tax=Vibrio sp. MA40-2 TaxID=3391828 RepID=UPI0039A67913
MITKPLCLSHIGLLGCDTRTRDQLLKVSSRIGLQCQSFVTATEVNKTDVLIVDIAHCYRQNLLDSALPINLPIIGLLAHGSPTEIDKSIELGAMAVIHKPINQNGLYAALSMAQRLKQQQTMLVDELADLRNRQQQRTVVIKATTLLMERYEVDVDKALSMLRTLSMQNNQSLEQLCQDMVVKIPKLTSTNR